METKILKTQNQLRIVFFAALLFFCSCQKLVELDAPRNSVNVPSAFKDQNSVQATIAGMYATTYGSSTAYSYAISLLTGLLADEMQYNGTTWDQYKNNGLLSNESTVTKVWSSSYFGIYQANAIIEGVTQANLTTAFRDQATGEALFIRAFCYFYLVNLYGDVPLVTNTVKADNELSPRRPTADIYKQIIADLEQAQILLPVSYPSASSPTVINRTRVNKYAAAALLARVYLYQKNYAAAEAKASEVISALNVNAAPLYTMVDPSAAFLNSSTEAIWSFDCTNVGYTSVGGQTVPNANATPNFIILDGLATAFENGDKRKTIWIGTSAGKLYPNKYRTKTKLNQESDVVLRLAEQYLIRAEAKVQLNRLGDAEGDINAVRNRAGLGGLTLTSQPMALDAIAKERRLEFFSEWGHRWLDLKRTGKVDVVISALKPGMWQSTDALFPIPTIEIANNPNLVPNPGYF